MKKSCSLVVMLWRIVDAKVITQSNFCWTARTGAIFKNTAGTAVQHKASFHFGMTLFACETDLNS